MKAGSLRGRLVRVLITLQVVAGVSVLAALVAWSWGSGRMVDESGARIAKVLGEAISRAESGELVLEPNARTREVFDKAPDYWFIARDEAGHELQRGNVPPRYVELARSAKGIGRSALDLLDEEQRPQARLEHIESPNGAFNLVVQAGGPMSVTETLRLWLFAYLILIAPVTMVTTLVVAVATPFVVKRTLRRITTAAAQIERVDIESLSQPLPGDQIPSELRPFIKAVNRAFQRLREAHERQARFLADAAHELRTPISTLRIQIDSLPDAHSEKLILQRSTTRLMLLAENLLNVQRLKRPVANFQPVDLQELCEQVVGDLAPLVIASGCTISLEPGPTTKVDADSPSIERALSNLILNAVDHGGKGCEIRVSVERPATLVVDDSGPGIPASQRERVLEPFKRFGSLSHGTGLGLYLVTEVAKLHHGGLKIGESPLGGASVRLAIGQAAGSQ